MEGGGGLRLGLVGLSGELKAKVIVLALKDSADIR